MNPGAEVFELILWALVWALLIGILLYMLRRRKPAEPLPLPAPAFLPSMLTPAESRALDLAITTGSPVQFMQRDPFSGVATQFIATPTGGGHGHISLAVPVPYGYGGPIKSV